MRGLGITIQTDHLSNIKTRGRGGKRGREERRSRSRDKNGPTVTNTLSPRRFALKETLGSMVRKKKEGGEIPSFPMIYGRAETN